MPSVATIFGLVLAMAATGDLFAQGTRPTETVPQIETRPQTDQRTDQQIGYAPEAPRLLPSAVQPAAYNEEVRTPNRPAPSATPSAVASATPVSSSSRETPLAFGSGANGKKASHEKTSGVGASITIGGSLAIVLGLFFLVAWMMRKASPRGSMILPGAVFEVLGRAPLASRQQVHLLRCGSKLLLVSVTPGGSETLTEVTDREEVDRLTDLCRQSHPKSAAVAFKQVFQQFAPGAAKARVTASESDDLGRTVGARKRPSAWENDNV